MDRTFGWILTKGLHCHENITTRKKIRGFFLLWIHFFKILWEKYFEALLSNFHSKSMKEKYQNIKSVNSGNKYSISHKNITDTTKDLVLLPNASCCQQKFLNRILHVVANTSGKIIYMCVLHLVYYFTCRKDVRTQKHYNHPYTPKYWVLTICLPQI